MPGIAQRQSAHLRNPGDAEHGNSEPRKRRQEQRHLVMEAVQHQQADERQQRQRAELLRAPANMGQGGERFVDRLLRLQRALMISCGVKNVVTVERRRPGLR